MLMLTWRNMLANFMKHEADFSTCDRLLAMFTYARINGVRLDEAREALDYDREDLMDAMRYRWNLLDGASGGWTKDGYRESIEEGCKRLAAAN